MFSQNSKKDSVKFFSPKQLKVAFDGADSGDISMYQKSELPIELVTNPLKDDFDVLVVVGPL